MGKQRHTKSPARALRHLAKAGEVEDKGGEEVPAANDLISNNPQFAAVFKGALQRGGRGALTKNAQPAEP